MEETRGWRIFPFFRSPSLFPDSCVPLRSLFTVFIDMQTRAQVTLLFLICLTVMIMLSTVHADEDIDEDCKIGCLAIRNPLSFCLQQCRKSYNDEWLDA